MVPPGDLIRRRDEYMAWKTSGSVVSILLGLSLFSPGFLYAQEAGQAAAQANPAAQKYKLTIMENAATTRRVKKGRVSAEAVVRVTDTNNLPVPGITVTFLLPQYGSGAAFSAGGLSSVVTTNAAGIATSSSITATAGSSLSVSVSAAVPGGMLTGTVPISTGAAVAGAGAGGAAAGGAAGGG